MKRVIATFTVPFFNARALAQWTPPDEVLQVHARGEGGWAVNCQWQDRRGKPVTREMQGKGRGRWERLHAIEPSGGSCTYRAASDQSLTIRLRSPLYRCTLPSPGAEGCEQTFPAGTSGEFAIETRGQ